MGFTLLNPVHLLFINPDHRLLPGTGAGHGKRRAGHHAACPVTQRTASLPAAWALISPYQGILIAGITMLSHILGHCMEVGFFEMPHGVSPTA